MGQVQRNDPCPCGSGKKYKKCCLEKKAANFDGKRLWTRNKFVYCVLITIFALSIFLRYYGFQQPHGLTFDEGLYSEALAKQLQVDPTNYSTQEAYQAITATGRSLPQYLDRPLFKHPPLYNYLIAFSYTIFGSSHLTAVSVSILFGSLMVLVVFLLGRELYDDRVGLLAAFFLCVDPIHWICSERIWMETTMSFFMLLSILLFVYGQKQKRFLLLSGVSIGLAMLTKYPGILPIFIIISYVALSERRMITRKDICLLCLTSFIIFLPWVIWNWKVYGNLFDAVISAHGLGNTIGHSVQSLMEHKLVLAFLLFVSGMVVWIRKKTNSQSNGPAKTVAGLSLCALAIIATPFLRGMFAEAFIWKGSILTGWSNPFSMGPWHFYLTRLSELSPVYLFSFLSFMLLLGRHRGDRLLLIASFWILGAFILLGNYQSRYILPAVPFLIILSARFQILMYDKLSLKSTGAEEPSNYGLLKAALKVALIVIGIYFTAKTLQTDSLLAIGPDFGYF